MSVRCNWKVLIVVAKGRMFLFDSDLKESVRLRLTHSFLLLLLLIVG